MRVTAGHGRLTLIMLECALNGALNLVATDCGLVAYLRFQVAMSRCSSDWVAASLVIASNSCWASRGPDDARR
jgi:hypothetical protein